LDLLVYLLVVEEVHMRPLVHILAVLAVVVLDPLLEIMELQVLTTLEVEEVLLVVLLWVVQQEMVALESLSFPILQYK
jgi:hypothetical protein